MSSKDCGGLPMLMAYVQVFYFLYSAHILFSSMFLKQLTMTSLSLIQIKTKVQILNLYYTCVH